MTKQEMAVMKRNLVALRTKSTLSKTSAGAAASNTNKADENPY